MTAALVIASCLLGGTASAQSTYTFTVIAEMNNCFNIGAPVMNASGEVAFSAVCGAPLGNGTPTVFRGNGGPLTTIVTLGTGSIGPDGPISINDSGVVAVSMRLACASFSTGIYVGNGGAPTPVVTTCGTAYKSVYHPAIANDGSVAFMADTDGTDGYDSVILASGGGFVTIAGPGTTSAIGTFVSSGYPRISDNGIVAFLGQAATTFGLFTGTGGPVTFIAGGRAESIDNGVNNSGRVAFAQQSAEMWTGSGGPLTNIAMVPAGGYVHLFGPTSINNLGNVTFVGQTAAGNGVFTGPDSTKDYVLRPGDVVPGFGTVASVTSTAEGLNDAGQVALTVAFAPIDGAAGKIVIFRAEPNPPNLAVASIKAPTATAPGASIVVKDTIRNSGTGGASPSVTRLWLSTNKTLGGDVTLADRNVPAVAAGATNAGSTSVTIPAVAPGAYYLLAQADSDGDVGETSETDNLKAKAIVIGADLTIKTLAFSPTNPTSSAPTTISVLVRNAGGAPSGATVTRLYRSTNAKLETGVDTELASLPLASLNAGASTTQQAVVTLPAGTYYILAVVDATNALPEAKETNNLKKAQKIVP